MGCVYNMSLAKLCQRSLVLAFEDGARMKGIGVTAAKRCSYCVGLKKTKIGPRHDVVRMSSSVAATKVYI